MGLGRKIFILEDTGDIRPIPNRLYDQLADGTSTATFPEYMNKQVKVLELFLEFRDRKPKKIYSTEKIFFKFDNNGKIDPAKNDLISRDVGNILSSIFSVKRGDILSELKPDLESLKFKDKYTWKISDEELEKVENLVFSF